jgi:diguanylate cyclase (GGDEF)-like protein/PAS domain S-box-containing protein
MNRRKRLRLIALIAAAYAAGGSLWIVASDRLLAGLGAGSMSESFGTFKGLAFVAVTTALLIITLRYMPGTSSREAAPLSPRSIWPPLAAIMALGIAVGLVAFVTYRLQIDGTKRDTLEDLQAVARLKVTGLSQWLGERRSDAESTGHNGLLQRTVHQWRRSGVDTDRDIALDALRDIKLSNGFARVSLMTGNGDLLLTTNPAERIPLDLSNIARAANATRRTIFVDFYRDETDSKIHFGFAVPIATLDGTDARGRDVLLFDLHAADFINPFLATWPLPGDGGELILARREEDEIVVLNPLRDDSDSALNLSVPLANTDDPVVRYLLRGEHQIEGTDHRGLSVLAAALSVPRTEWILVAKINHDIAIAGVQGRTIVVSVSTLAGLIALIATVAYLWQSRRLQAALQAISTQQANELAEERFRATFEEAPVGIAHLSFDGRILRANREYCRIHGHPLTALQVLGVLELSTPEDRAQNAELLGRFRVGEISTYQGERRGYRDGGEEVWFTVSISLVRDKSAQPDYLIDVITDITERKRSEKSLQRASTVFQNTQEGIVVTDAGGDILSINPAFESITGYSEAELIGKNMRILQSGQHDRDFYRDMWERIAKEGAWQGEIWNRRKDGEPYPEFLTISTIKDETGQPMGYVGTFVDITGIKETESRLVHLAHHDALTGLPNRLLVMSRLEYAIQVAKRKKAAGAVMFLDLDRFKNVNDSLGHPSGDELLLAVTKRLSARLRASDTLARLGGDEFLILLQDVQNPSAVAALAQIVLEQFDEPFSLSGGQEVYIGTSIGISLFPEDGDQADEIVKNADAALYRAKEEGRGVYRFYTAALTDKANERLSMERRLRRAIERDEFLLHFQPLVRIADRRIVGFEALVRWQEPGNGLIPPGSFIPLAEETGIILPLGERVLRMACQQMKNWLEAGYEISTMAVNLSPRQFHLPDIDEIVSGILTETGLPAHFLELELTEGALIEQGIGAEMRLAALRKLGVRVSIDDFGTGYSSLSYLKRFPINKLKVDQSFVRDIPGDPADMEITSAIIGLARNLRLDCIAEGVETEAQLAFLREQDCDFAQGYLFSKPLPATDAEGLLEHDMSARAPIARSSF